MGRRRAAEREAQAMHHLAPAAEDAADLVLLAMGGHVRTVASGLLEHAVDDVGHRRGIGAAQAQFLGRPSEVVQGRLFEQDDQLAAGQPALEGLVEKFAGEVGAPDLKIIKTVNKDTVSPGDKEIEYEITITNNGNLTGFPPSSADISMARATS